MTWQDVLLEGKLSEAKLRYLESNDEDVLGAFFWKDLERIQKYLRAKHWQRAYNAIEDIEIENESIATFIDKELLSAELEVLKEASTLLDRRRPEEAIAKLQDVKQPLYLAEKLCQEGTAHIFLNELETAKSLFATALEADEKHYRVITNLGNIELEAKNIDNAIQYYEKALDLRDDFGNAMHNLGVAYRQKGQISKSVGLIRKAQGNVRKAEAEDARGKLSSSLSGPFGGKQGAKYLQYGLYALALIAFLFILRSRGII